MLTMQRTTLTATNLIHKCPYLSYSVTAVWLVLICHPAEGERLSRPWWLICPRTFTC